MHAILQAPHHLHHSFIKEAMYTLQEVAAQYNKVYKIVHKHMQEKELYTNQAFFDYCFIFRLSNGQFLTREVTAQDHVRKLPSNTCTMSNGSGFVLESLKLFEPNGLKKE